MFTWEGTHAHNITRNKKNLRDKVEGDGDGHNNNSNKNRKL